MENKVVYVAKIREMLGRPYMNILKIDYSYQRKLDAFTLRVREHLDAYIDIEGIREDIFTVQGAPMGEAEANEIIRAILRQGYHIIKDGGSDNWNNIATLYAQRAKGSDELMNYMISRLRD